MTETVLPKTQTTSPTTPHCRRFSPRWSALWAPRRPEPRPHHPEPRPDRPGPRPHRHQRGNCTIRGATRRRHADRMLLMVQNPHHYPGVMLPRGSIAPSLVQDCPAKPGWTPVGHRKQRWRIADTAKGVIGSQLRDNAWSASPTETGQGTGDQLRDYACGR